MQPLMPGFLDHTLQLLLFGGKGGVGKTTCAAAAAIRIARSAPGKAFRLLSADPAHSLWDSLADCTLPGNLTVVELDARQRADAFLAAERGRLREIAVAGTFLDEADIDQLLSLSLPGLDELAVFLEISDLLEHGVCDGIVVDTAPSGHTLELLTMPRNLRMWVAALDALLAKRRYMQRVFQRQTANDPLEQLVSRWSTSLDRIETLLRDPARCCFVPVTTAEALGVRETAGLWKQLRKLQVPVSDLVVNQVHAASSCQTCSRDHNAEQEQIARLRAMTGAGRLWTVELLEEEVRGERMLAGFWGHAQIFVAPSGSKTKTLAVPVPEGRVERPVEPPSAQVQLLLFSGKGGVGKTTLACATALRMARDFPQKRILLLSTDPAHSLSACLRIGIGRHPSPVCGNLAAMEIDACAALNVFRRECENDLGEWLDPHDGEFEVAFDRAALEKVLQLAPPGIEELMALTSVVDLLARDRYDLFVVDSASTGHFIRLLELPRLIEHWLKMFFGLLLKYKNLLRLPRFADRLIALSKNLKTFRRILADSARCALYAVSIPTQMAFEETRDLLAACGRIGIAAPLIFLNRLTPPADCRLCSAVRDREAAVASGFAETFPDRRMVFVYRQGEPAGLDRLACLAGILYRTPV
ncbi:MAG: ArsA family ATPase [Acidobacteriia bacterium]|nr:ArsA family ATPase [Terriglobia bacterium]